MDIEALRAQTPGIGNALYLNNASCSLMPRPVIEAVADGLALEAEHGGYRAVTEQAGKLEGVYRSLARLINAHPDEIAIMNSHTDAWQAVFYGLAFKPGDRILTCRSEYGANYVAFLQMRKRTGCSIEVVPNDESGATDPRALEDMIDERVRLIALNWIPTNGGLINPAAEIGAIARKYAIPYLLDACQAVGQLPVDVAALGCDYLSCAGRKWLRGPKGTGFLYVRRERLAEGEPEPAMIDDVGAAWVDPERYALRPDARRYERHEHAPALRLGLAAAAEYAMALGLGTIRERVGALAQRLRTELAALPGVRVEDLGREQAGLVTLRHERVGAGQITEALGRAGIIAKTVPQSGALLDSLARGNGELVRLSPHYFNTEEELEQALRVIGAVTGSSSGP